MGRSSSRAPVKAGTVCLSRHGSRSKPGVSRPPLALTLGWAPRTPRARGAAETRVAPRVAAHTRRCRLRSSSPASRAQLIRAALQAPRLGPAESRARRPRAANPGPGRAPRAARAGRAAGGGAARTVRRSGEWRGPAAAMEVYIPSFRHEDSDLERGYTHLCVMT
ncbi:sorting nexin-24 isoform X5 [Mesocricetus auratus]|uniref:Sorting nexin-24 isoform X5 n=1 Tax=Mesocricetus auratus TaxID=10036 RepID=A0ABM2X4G8_MESAU|nr:sorting nexin-24 isoform X5 [Mesocricetus auratus]